MATFTKYNQHSHSHFIITSLPLFKKQLLTNKNAQCSCLITRKGQMKR